MLRVNTSLALPQHVLTPVNPSHALVSNLTALYVLQEQVVARKLSDRWASPGLTTFGEDGYQSIEKLLVTDPRW